MPIWSGNGNNGLGIFVPNVVVKGFTFQKMSTALTVANGASLLAYANNVMTYTTALAGGGAFAGTHNFWDSYFTQPPGLDSTSWNAHLGADVEAWAESTTNAALSGAYIAGSLSPGRQLVIVEHGRGLIDAPFGNGIVPHADNMCSPYYDIFTVGGSSEDVITYEIGLPVDNRPLCLDNSLDKVRAYWVPDFSELKCTPAGNSQCWDPFPAARITKDTANNLLILSDLTIEELRGTPFVVGDDQGGDPTFVSLTSFSAAGASTPSPLLLVQVFLLLLGLGIWVHARKAIPVG